MKTIIIMEIAAAKGQLKEIRTSSNTWLPNILTFGTPMRAGVTKALIAIK